MRHKFDFCYVMVKEAITFQKYAVLHEIEARH